MIFRIPFLTILQFLLLVQAHAFVFPVQTDQSEYHKKKFKNQYYEITSKSQYTFKTCQKFNDEAKEKYFLECDENGVIWKEQPISGLSDQVNAVHRSVVENEFLTDYKKYVLAGLTKSLKEVQSLKACLYSIDSTAEVCQKQKEAIVNGVKSDLPRLRVLLAQMNMPGKIFSATKPLRFQKKIKHPSSNELIPDLSLAETNFLIRHTEELEDSFREEIINTVDQLKDCKTQKPCLGKETIIDAHMTKMFERQNKKYAQAYDEQLSKNPMLNLLNLTGEENSELILQRVKEKLNFLEKSVESSLEKIRSLNDKDRIELLALSPTIEKYLENQKTQVSCDIAEKLKEDQEFDELKDDLFVGAAALAGGGICALTMGWGCALTVAIGAEVGSVRLANGRYQDSKNYFYAGQQTAEDLSAREFENNMAMYLAPLALVGGGYNSGKIALKMIPEKPTNAVVRWNYSNREMYDIVEKNLQSSKVSLVNKFNPGNRHNLSRSDEMYFAGIADHLVVQSRKDFPNLSSEELDNIVSKKLDKLIKDCHEK